jgi:hypothetical protein
VRLPLLLLLILSLVHASTSAGDWQAALSTMPLAPLSPPSAARPSTINHHSAAALAKAAQPSIPTELNRTNCVSLLLGAFQSNQTVKALIFMPGATDELYMFRRARAVVTNSSPTLHDAVIALTNQTHIRATFRSPFLLLHSAEDPLEPILDVRHESTAAKLQKRAFLPHALFNDNDWDRLQPVLKKRLKIEVKPWKNSYDSWHFYRHSLTAWNLNGWEALQATALAGKTRVTLTRNRAVFELDRRFRENPRLEKFPE